VVEEYSWFERAGYSLCRQRQALLELAVASSSIAKQAMLREWAVTAGCFN
jgi:hypothetical protein